MRIVLAIALILWLIAFGRLMARLLLPADVRHPVASTVTGAALGLGAATLVPFWVMLAWPGGPAFELTLLVSLLAAGVAWIRNRREARQARPPLEPDGRSPLHIVALCVPLAIGGAIIFNAASWPFHEGDALALYAPFGRILYETRALPIGDRLYEAYPMLVPMTYALTHWAAGGVNEYVARLVPALMSVGAIGAAALLGGSVGSHRVGLAAAVLVAVTPTFGRWASTGYTDAPAALFVGLLAAFAGSWWATGDRRALALAGVCAGLAMWTRNSTLAFLPSLVWLVAVRQLRDQRAGALGPGPAVRDWLAAFVPIAVVAGPWYLRNILVFGFVVPPTIWTDRASRGVGSLAIMLRPDQSFGVSGWLFTIAVAYALASAFARRRSAGRWHVLLAFVVPYLAAWWWLASYESRFLVTIVPLLAVMAALMLTDAADAVIRHVSVRSLRWLTAGTAAVLVLATATALRKTVEHKAALLRDPFMNDAARHQVQLGGLYDVATMLNQLPPGSRVAGAPSILGYHLDLSRFGAVDFTPLSAPPVALSDRFDFAVYRPLGQETPWRAAGVPLLETRDGYRVYATGGGVRAEDRSAGPR